MNRQRIYNYIPDRVGTESSGIGTEDSDAVGPTFGSHPHELRIEPYQDLEEQRFSCIKGNNFDASQVTGDPCNELFGEENFLPDEYEVYKLE